MKTNQIIIALIKELNFIQSYLSFSEMKSGFYRHVHNIRSVLDPFSYLGNILS
jgi:hypothetical protein